MSKLGFSQRDNYTRCKNSAIYSLAMREHSRQELRNKLQQKKYVDGVDISKLLNELEESNYLNETRFVESYIRHRSSRGFGPIKIRSELQIRGINTNLINLGFEEAEADWYQNAKEQLQKKFGTSHSEDFKTKSKRMRFLSNKGFSNDIIKATIY